MYQILLVIFLIVATSLILLIIIQKGDDPNIKSSFGENAYSSFFRSTKGSGNFLTHMTAVLATLFFILSLILSNLSSNHKEIQCQQSNLNLENLKKFHHKSGKLSDIPQ
ncbi:preprotein translocase subunit SecG [Sodalis sp. CWE]|uniref:preprotein translocase subunit SecG n=1 Tax=Sodalis sp. CWE TaxID=2803816 RepID=UPI001C7D1460|nr:preprotein translocase subunit SecG [Sodalis sp. CWE]MBX4180789.1 preprotein translocase subunit SecG [Sodalis sp. CWE]